MSTQSQTKANYLAAQYLRQSPVLTPNGAVTQLTDKTTDVTLDTMTGRITMAGTLLGTRDVVDFNLNNSHIEAEDMVVVQHVAGGTLGVYTCTASAFDGGAVIHVRNVTPGNLSEAIILEFVVFKVIPL